MATILLILLLILGPPGRSTGRGTPDRTGVRFNEILADAPGPEGDGAGEWIELRGDGPLAVDLQGWLLGDRGDTGDRLRAWASGGPTCLEPRGLALILDPDADPARLDLPAGVLLLTVDDGSLGNGLGAESDALTLTAAAGGLVDSVSWTEGAGDGISFERVEVTSAGAVRWRRCRAPRGSTPGRTNSWTPLAGDRSLRFAPVGNVRAAAARPGTIRARLKDEGGAGLPPLGLEFSAFLDGRLVVREQNRIEPLDPGDSTTVVWTWIPPEGGEGEVRAVITDPPALRPWWDADSLAFGVRFAPLSRVLTEAQPRPLPGREEWLEFGTADGAAGAPSWWTGWRLRVGSTTGGEWSPRERLLTTGDAEIILVAAGEGVRIPGRPEGLRTTGRSEIWPGLRLADAGCAVVLIDPYGGVVDSACLRPAPDLPRGHSWQRWETGLSGWLPAAWGFAPSPEAVTPGWIAGRAPVPEPAGTVAGFRFDFEHTPDGAIVLAWQAPTPRLWIGAELYDLNGTPVGTPMPRILARGCEEYRWDPRLTRPRVEPGLYVLIVRAEAEGEGRTWTVRRALGVRP